MEAPITILLVDDEPKNLQVLTVILESPEFELVQASSADDALYALMHRDFAAIVLDVRMPGLDGIELARMIKQRPRTQHIPIVFLTAYDEGEEQIVQGYGVGAVDYITKPVNPTILRSKIGVFIDLFKKNRALAAMNLAMSGEIAERQKAEERFRTVVEAAPNAIVVFSADRVISLVNPRVEAIFGHSRAELLGKPLEMLVPDAAATLAAVESRSFSETVKELTGKKRDGSILPLEAIFGRYESAEGTFYMASMVDITARKQVESALLNANAELEAKNAELLQQASDRARRIQAEQARAEAESANRAKDHFLAMLSHELRTPLSPVLHAVTLLQEQGCPDSMKETLETIRRNVQLESRLIDDLLDLAKIRNGKLQLHLETADAHELLRRALAICATDIEAKQLAVKHDFGATQFLMQADPARVQQIFWNLITNAIKYTPAGGVLSVATSNENGMIRIEVTDSGIGIDPAKLGEVFSAFTQLHHDHSRGLGLGLAICRAITELHGGFITAKSAGPGKGATFTVELPVAANLVEQNGVPAAPGGTETAVPLRILLVEDHADTIQTLSKLLTRRNYQLRTAINFQQALDVAGDYEFDVLISDIGLPDGSGLELMRRLATRRIRGIALSGFGMQEDLDRSRDAGFSEHFVKPVDIQRLHAALIRIGREQSSEPALSR